MTIDLIKALQERFPKMDEAEAAGVAEGLRAIFADDASILDHLDEGLLEVKISIARAAYAAGVKAERERAAEIAHLFKAAKAATRP